MEWRIARGQKVSARYTFATVRRWAEFISKGRLDSTGNTRTCGGGESFLGRPKDVDLSHALRGLAAAATGARNDVLLEVARRFSGWANTTTASCYP